MFDHHRHFCGSIPVETIIKLLRSRISIDMLKERIVITEPVSFKEFLQRFELFDYVSWDEFNLKFAFQSAVDDVEKDPDLEGASFICSVDKYRLKPAHCFDLFNDVKKNSSKKIGLILGIKYEKCDEFVNNYDSYKECFKFIDGVNFISKENQMKRKIIEMIINKLKDYNIQIGMHVGEMGGNENVQFAIDAGVNIISHGTKANDDTVRKALGHGILIDVSLVSNLLTSVIRNPSEHGFFNYLDNPNVRLVSDDPVIFNNTVSKEIELYHNAIKSPILRCVPDYPHPGYYA